MYKSHRTVLGLLMVAALTAACGPTDTDINTKVKANLSLDETARAAQINVGVQKKVVTLSGTVDHPAMKERAVAVARGTEGVSDVVDQITIRAQVAGPGVGHGREMMGKGMMDGTHPPATGKRE